jgi:hypothetical protein
MEWSPGTDRSKPFCQVVQFISQKTHVFFWPREEQSNFGAISGIDPYPT